MTSSPHVSPLLLKYYSYTIAKPLRWVLGELSKNVVKNTTFYKKNPFPLAYVQNL